VASIAATATGFLYLVSMTGVTGGALSDTSAVEAMIGVVRESATIPACVGFGVRDAASARRLGAIADGVVVGSEIVRVLRRGVEEKVGARYVGELVRSLRGALDEGVNSGE
jgi:tryptophan synthase alpha chain